MSKETYNLDDLDAILAEFSDKKTQAPEQSFAEPTVSVRPSGQMPPVREEPPAPVQSAREKPAGNSVEEFEAVFSNRRTVIQKAEEKPQKPAPARRAPAPAPRLEKPLKNAPQTQAPKKAASVKAPKPNPVRPPAKPVSPQPEKPVRRLPAGLNAVLSIVFAVVSAAALVWVLFNIHPASGTVSTAGTETKLKLSDKLDVYMNNMASDALGDQSYIKKIYTLQESDTVSPVPNPDCFGTTDDPAVIQDVIKRASILLDGQKVTFDPNADFVPGTPFRYYLDDTILVIAWQEYINESCCTCAEVKIAHGSQIRRKLAEDSYSSSVQLYASDMANASNAVIAINGDFYAFRELGITAYQRKLYRNNPATVDSCFFTASGDMLFSRAGELMGEGETEQFLQDNDVVFAIAFGPVLVDNGELQYCEHYPIGEIDTEYSRSCIAMTDELHYFLMTINHTEDGRPRANINQLARYIYAKGVQKAYTLDGGQTSEIIMMGGPINHVDFGAERTVSDIIYFATAIPDEGVSQ